MKKLLLLLAPTILLSGYSVEASNEVDTEELTVLTDQTIYRDYNINGEIAEEKLNHSFIHLVNIFRIENGKSTLDIDYSLQPGSTVRSVESAVMGTTRHFIDTVDNEYVPNRRPNGETFDTAFNYLDTPVYDEIIVGFTYHGEYNEQELAEQLFYGVLAGGSGHDLLFNNLQGLYVTTQNAGYHADFEDNEFNERDNVMFNVALSVVDNEDIELVNAGELYVEKPMSEMSVAK